jgi:hypothetical protein
LDCRRARHKDILNVEKYVFSGTIFELLIVDLSSF